jgi:hypothetical protein
MGLMVLAKKGGERSGVRSLLHFFLGSRDSQSLFLDNGFRWANGVPMASQRNSSQSHETSPSLMKLKLWTQSSCVCNHCCLLMHEDQFK